MEEQLTLLPHKRAQAIACQREKEDSECRRRNYTREEASQTRRHRISDTKSYSLTSPTRSPKQGFTCVPEVLTKMGQLLQL